MKNKIKDSMYELKYKFKRNGKEYKFYYMPSKSEVDKVAEEEWEKVVENASVYDLNEKQILDILSSLKSNGIIDYEYFRMEENEKFSEEIENELEKYFYDESLDEFEEKFKKAQEEYVEAKKSNDKTHSLNDFLSDYEIYPVEKVSDSKKIKKDRRFNIGEEGYENIEVRREWWDDLISTDEYEKKLLEKYPDFNDLSEDEQMEIQDELFKDDTHDIAYIDYTSYFEERDGEIHFDHSSVSYSEPPFWVKELFTEKEIDQIVSKAAEEDFYK